MAFAAAYARAGLRTLPLIWADCAGIALTRFAGADPAQPAAAGCADEADVTAPTAIAVTGEGTAVWAGETLTTISG